MVNSYVNLSTCGIIDAAFLSGDDEVRLNDTLSTASGTCLSIEVSNFILDCRGFLINSTDNTNTIYGIDLNNSINISVQNCNVQNFGDSAGETGINIIDANTRINLKNSNFSYNFDGIRFISDDSQILNVISNNNLNDGISLGSGSSINITNLIASYNGDNGFIRKAPGNTYYLKLENSVFNNNIGDGIFIDANLQNSTFNTITTNNNAGNGMYFSYVYYNTFSNLNSQNNTDGLHLSWYLEGNLFFDFNINLNTDDGLTLSRKIKNNGFIDGDLRNNGDDNIYFESVVDKPINTSFKKIYIGVGSDIDSNYNFTDVLSPNFLEGNYWDDFNSNIHPPYCYTGAGWSFCDNLASFGPIPTEQKLAFPFVNILSLIYIYIILALYLYLS